MNPAIVRTYRMIQTIRYEFSNLRLKKDLFSSQFHLNGHRHFQRSRELTRNPTNNLLDIQKATLSLQKIRMVVQKTNSNEPMSSLTQEQSQQLKNYLESYLKLIEAIKESKLNQQWFYQIAGWYNIQSIFPNLIEKLFIQNNKKRHFALIEALSWMQPHLYTIPSDLQFYQIQKLSKNIDNYYKELNSSFSVETVKKIQSILQHMQTPNKARFYQRFTHNNISNILKHTDLHSKSQVDDVFWLYKIYVGNFNDKQDIIDQFDRFIQQLQPNALDESNLLTLMKIYSSKGRIDKQVYEKHIRQFISPNRNNSINFVVKSLSFVLQSEAEDPQMISVLVKFISKTLQNYKVRPEIMLEIHFLCHYMFIKDIKVDLQKSTLKELHECCRQHEGNGSIARTVAISLDQKGRKQGKTYYESECLRKQREISMIKQDIGQQIKMIADYKKFKRVRICTIDIADCVVNDQTKDVIVLENMYNRFEHSKRLSRYFELRESILGHYGVKVNYLQKKESFKSLPVNQNVDDLI